MSQIEGSAVHDIRDLVAATLKTNTDIPSVVVPDGFDIKLPRLVFARIQT